MNDIRFKNKYWNPSSFNVFFPKNKKQEVRLKFVEWKLRKDRVNLCRTKRDVSFFYNRRAMQRNRFPKGFQSRTQVICCKDTNHVANDKCLDKCGDFSLEEREFSVDNLNNNGYNNIYNNTNNNTKKNKRRKKSIVWKLSTWNIRTMGNEDDEKVMQVKTKRKLDKLPFIIEECREFNLDVVCLQEVRRIQQGCVQRDGFLFYFSGHNSLKKEGVGLVFSGRFFDEVKIVKYVSSRIMWVAGTVDGMEVVIFSVYAPTNVYPITIKQKFYEELENELKGVPREFKSRVFIGGDFNARIGTFEKGLFDNCRGKFIDGIQNENGLLLMEFCLRNSLYISNTGFQKSRYGTWRHPRSKVAVTLDFWLINKEGRGSMKNCKVNYVADALTDHNMVELEFFADVKKKFLGKFKVVKNKKLNYNALRIDSDLCVTLGKEIDSVIEVMDKEVDYNTFSQYVGEVCIKMLPEKVKLKGHKDWFDARRTDVIELISQRRNARKKYLQNSSLEYLHKYKSLRKECQRRCREMRNNFWIDVADNIQEMYDCNNSRGYFDALKILYGCKKGGALKYLLNLDGTKAVMEEDVMNRWHEHFRNLLNQEATAKGSILDYLPEKAQVIDQLDSLFTEEEVYIAFNMMKYEKAAGVDGRQIEVENFVESEFLVKTILSYYNKALNDGVVPSEWKDVIIATLFKKGATESCDNYRGLSLITHVGKALERVIQNRLVKYAELLNWIPESQCGFRSERGTVDVIFVSRYLSSLVVEKEMKLYKCFVDLTKAYDKVDRDILWMVLERRGVPIKLLNLLKGLLVGAVARVRVNGKFSEQFILERGLKQGSVISPLLFNIFFGAIIQEVMRRLKLKGVGGITLKFKIGGNIFDLNELKRKADIQNIRITDLLFADDAEFIANSQEELQCMVDVFVEVSEVFGQELAIKKTEVMVVSREDGVNQNVNIMVRGIPLKVVKTFKYLGSTENSVANMSNEVEIRVQKMGSSYAILSSRIFENRYVKAKTKFRAFEAIVLSNALYGSATWNISVKQIEKLESKQFQLLRRMLGFSWKDFISYEKLMELAEAVGEKIVPIEGKIRFNRLKYLGHVERMDDIRLPKIVLHGDLVEGKRKRGGQLLMYRHCIKEDLKLFNINYKTWQVECLDRNSWRKLLYDGLKKFQEQWLQKREATRCKRKIKEVEKQGGRRFRAKINDSETLTVIRKRNICFDKFSKIDEILKSNDGRIVKGRGSKEANKVKYKINNIRISRTGRLVEMFKSLRNSR